MLAANDLITTCYSTEYAQALSAAAVKAGVKVKVHLKIDTGMGRIGFAVRSGFAETILELEALYALPGLDICGVFQHFAVADSVEPDDDRYTDEQHALFAQSWSGCVRTAALSARYTAPTLPHSCATPSGGTT